MLRMTRKSAMLAVALVLLASGGASALTKRSAPGAGAAAGQGLVGTYCRKEIGRYCPGVAHRSGLVPQCLLRHKQVLSRSCERALVMKGPGGGLGQGMAAKGRLRRW